MVDDSAIIIIIIIFQTQIQPYHESALVYNNDDMSDWLSYII